MVGAAGAGAEAAFRLQAAVRLLKRGRITDATIVSLDERLISAPSGIGFSGWVTKVEVSFTDASGHLINAGYTDYGRAEGKREGQTVQIAYDPSSPVSIAPAGGGGARSAGTTWRAFRGSCARSAGGMPSRKPDSSKRGGDRFSTESERRYRLPAKRKDGPFARFRALCR